MPEGNPDWWRTLSCDIIGNEYYSGKTVQQLSHNLLWNAVTKWVPKVRAHPNPHPNYKLLADAIEVAFNHSCLERN